MQPLNFSNVGSASKNMKCVILKCNKYKALDNVEIWLLKHFIEVSISDIHNSAITAKGPNEKKTWYQVLI